MIIKKHPHNHPQTHTVVSAYLYHQTGTHFLTALKWLFFFSEATKQPMNVTATALDYTHYD